MYRVEGKVIAKRIDTMTNYDPIRKALRKLADELDKDGDYGFCLENEIHAAVKAKTGTKIRYEVRKVIQRHDPNSLHGLAEKFEAVFEESYRAIPTY